MRRQFDLAEFRTSVAVDARCARQPDAAITVDALR
jgi:hypothetical protein